MTQPWACHILGLKAEDTSNLATDQRLTLTGVEEKKREIERQKDLGSSSASRTPGTLVTLKANSLFSLYIQNVWREHETCFPHLFHPLCSPLFGNFILSSVALMNAAGAAALKSFVRRGVSHRRVQIIWLLCLTSPKSPELILHSSSLLV